MLTAAPPLGANGIKDRTNAPAKNTGMGGPGTLVAAKSVPFISPPEIEVVMGRGSSVNTL